MRKTRLKEAPDEVKLDPPRSEKTRAVSTDSRISIGCVMDNSPSMDRNGALVHGWNGFNRFQDELLKDQLLKNQLDFALDSFSDRRIPVKPYGSMEGWEPRGALIDLPRGPRTCLGEAMLEHFDDLERHLRELRDRQGLSVRGSLVLVITDGGHNGDPAAFDEACARARALEKRVNLRVLGVGVEGAQMEVLSRLAPHPVRLAAIESFQEFWIWLLASARRVSGSMPGETVELPNPFRGLGNENGFAERWTL